LTITVTPVNDAPTITSTAVTTATEDIAYTYTITTEDVDGDVVTVSASGLPSWLTLSGDTHYQVLPQKETQVQRLRYCNR
jgi:hypothetical protein